VEMSSRGILRPILLWARKGLRGEWKSQSLIKFGKSRKVGTGTTSQGAGGESSEESSVT